MMNRQEQIQQQAVRMVEFTTEYDFEELPQTVQSTLFDAAAALVDYMDRNAQRNLIVDVN